MLPWLGDRMPHETALMFACRGFLHGKEKLINNLANGRTSFSITRLWSIEATIAFTWQEIPHAALQQAQLEEHRRLLQGLRCRHLIVVAVVAASKEIQGITVHSLRALCTYVAGAVDTLFEQALACPRVRRICEQDIGSRTPGYEKFRDGTVPTLSRVCKA